MMCHACGLKFDEPWELTNHPCTGIKPVQAVYGEGEHVALPPVSNCFELTLAVILPLPTCDRR